MQKLFRILGSTLGLFFLFVLGSASCSNDNVQVEFATLSVQIVGSGTVSSAPGGISCEPDCSVDFEVGSEVTLSANPNPGFEFVGWSGIDCAGTDPCTFTVDSDLQVTATFKIFQIVYTSRAALDGSDAINTNGVYNIWVIDQDGQNAKPLTTLVGPDADSFTPQWSPDNGKIVYESTRAFDGSDSGNPNSVLNIWAMNADGTDSIPLTQLTATSADSFDAQWAPDGSKILFTSVRDLNPNNDITNANFTSNIWVMNSDGSNPTPLTQLTATNASSSTPQWSPDGSKIAFRSQRDLDPSNDASNLNSTSNIWVMNSDGSNPTPLTELTANNANSFNPQWSPDGEQITYQSQRDINASNDAANLNMTSNIWVMDADGANAFAATTLTANSADSFIPQWSPDSLQIVYQSSAALDGSDAANLADNIWIIDSDGMNDTPLTFLTENNLGAFDPVFSSDGSKIAFDSEGALDGSDAANTNGTPNIFTINPDGSGIQSLTKNTADKAESFGPQFNN